MAGYLDQLKVRRGHRYCWSVRKLYAILCQYKNEDFLRAVELAAAHNLYDVARIEGILLQNLARQEYLLPLEEQDYEDSPGFIKGASTPPSDMSSYDAGENPEENDDD
jgi:hypothetical protein